MMLHRDFVNCCLSAKLSSIYEFCINEWKRCKCWKCTKIMLIDEMSIDDRMCSVHQHAIQIKVLFRVRKRLCFNKLYRFTCFGHFN